MSLTAGTRLGTYEITGHIGAGGMGEVYRATDTKLGREVAIKTLPASLAGDPDRLARFEREARLLAALNHPHIASVYNLDEHKGTLYLAMELVEGETLEEKLKPGALPVEDALRLALQIAEALEAAHGKGVIHRDLKPANIMVTGDGVVKVLDFGLAKAFSNEPEEASPGQSPALSLAMTQQGIILGTAGYMSPEQASGQPTDHRADIWAFGVVLYEMLTGLPLFSGESVPHILADVLRTEPDWGRLPRNLHFEARRALERCLIKKPRDRYHSIADARFDIEQALRDPEGLTQASVNPATARSVSGIRRFGMPAAFGVMMAAVAGLVVWFAMLPAPSEPGPVNRFEYEPGEDLGLNLIDFLPVMALSPDGRHLVYTGAEDRGLYLREMGTLQPRQVAGTEGPSGGPVFSPDGQWVAYFRRNTGAGRGELARIPISGGSPSLITPVDDSAAAGLVTWAADDTILFATLEGIFRVSANGGEPELVIPAMAGEILSRPTLLPDGRTVLYSAIQGQDWDAGQIVVETLGSGERKILVRGGSDARYVPTGHLVYAYGDGLFGIAFDLDELSVSGSRVPLLQGVSRASSSPVANFGVADDGTLVYLEGTGASGNSTLVWVDRNGVEEAIDAPPRNYAYVQISPDGERLALDIRDDDRDTWIWDLERENLQRLSFDPGLNRGVVWSPDGERVAFSRALDGTEEIYWQAWDGAGTAEPLTEGSDIAVIPVDFTPDGATLIYIDANPPGDIWTAPIDSSPSTGTALIATAADESNPAISPDGRWIAYQSDESGSLEIYVRPFPDVDSGRWQVSTNGGERPQWRADGGELFFIARDGVNSSVLSVAVEAEDSFRAATPVQLFEGPYFSPNNGRNMYAVTADGQRFVMIKLSFGTGLAEQPGFIIVQNWTEELKRLVPTD